MKTITAISAAFADALGDIYPKTEIESLKNLVINEVTGLSVVLIKAFSDKEITDAESERIGNILIRLKAGEPLQYVLGHTHFYGLEFSVNPSVLIPRPETEELVHWAISELKVKNSELNILDVGTGSGCIPVTLKKHIPTAQISAIDISADALNIAKANAYLHKVEIDWIKADILSADAGFGKYDVIISNPPYVTEAEKPAMHQNVLGFEPHSALFVPNDDPLLFYKAVARFAFRHFNDGGLLFFEINESFGMELIVLLTDAGYDEVELRKDMNGKDRMIKGRFKKDKM